jgi:hypothetical protein
MPCHEMELREFLPQKARCDLCCGSALFTLYGVSQIPRDCSLFLSERFWPLCEFLTTCDRKLFFHFLFLFFLGGEIEKTGNGV